MSLSEASRAIRAGRVSPVELTEACLAQVARYESDVHAFAALDADGARAAARESEREIRSGTWRGPLHGIPIGIKDVIDVAGFKTVANSRQREHVPAAEYDAASVARLRSGGAIILGKLTTHEFAFGIPERDSLHPAARNPWDLSRFAGGSSSGAAVATATGMVLGALGSDTAGSVRSPAALCGVTGFKPGRAHIDREGTIPLASSLDALGVIAPSVEDCAELYAAVLHTAEVSQLDTNVTGLRIGVIRHFFEQDAPVSGACSAAIDASLSVFEQLGCTVRDVALPPLADWHACGIAILLAEAYAYHEPTMQTHPERYERSFREAVQLGASRTAKDYQSAIEERRVLTTALEALALDYDVLVSAIQPGEAPPLDALSQWNFLNNPSYGLPFNISDTPALSVCCGFGPHGLPLAVQLLGRRDEEEMVLRVGHAYEEQTRWRASRSFEFSPLV